MSESHGLVAGFEKNRTRLRAVAYRMLGSLAEADDAVQETWLRLDRNGADDVDNLDAWLTTVVVRVCLNVLRSRNTRREEFHGVHVPDPIISRPDGLTPEDEAMLADSVGLALQVVLETLAPAERLAFVLHDMFDLPFDEIAPMVGRAPATARQLASRARRRVALAEVPDSDLGRQREVVDAFFAAARAATSTRSSPSSTPTWCCAPTPGPRTRTAPWWSAGRRRSRAGRCCSSGRPPRCGRHWSTAPRASS